MSALSIRAKVIAVIAFMLIAMSGMGFLAIRSMQVINAHTVEIATQGAATQEFSRNVQQAVQGTQMVSANITDVLHGATETETASSHVLSAAQSLLGDSTRLKLEVAKFLESVRAA
jgi:methyl-accepting chemotaxis protein